MQQRFVAFLRWLEARRQLVRGRLELEVELSEMRFHPDHVEIPGSPLGLRITREAILVSPGNGLLCSLAPIKHISHRERSTERDIKSSHTARLLFRDSDRTTVFSVVEYFTVYDEPGESWHIPETIRHKYGKLEEFLGL